MQFWYTLNIILYFIMLITEIEQVKQEIFSIHLMNNNYSSILCEPGKYLFIYLEQFCMANPEHAV